MGEGLSCKLLPLAMRKETQPRERNEELFSETQSARSKRGGNEARGQAQRLMFPFHRYLSPAPGSSSVARSESATNA